MISNLPENFNFNLGEEIDALQESIRAFCDKEIAPLAEEIDKSNNFPSDRYSQERTAQRFFSLYFIRTHMGVRV